MGLKWRATNLVKGIKGLVGNDEGTKILDHALVKTDVTSESKRKQPSYVSARNFTLALFQTVGDGALAAARDITEARTAIGKIPDGSPLGAQLKALVNDGDADLAKFRKSVEEWFDDGMDRVSGWYKRRTQFVTCVLAVAIAVGLNVDAIRVWANGSRTTRRCGRRSSTRPKKPAPPKRKQAVVGPKHRSPMRARKPKARSTSSKRCRSRSSGAPTTRTST